MLYSDSSDATLMMVFLDSKLFNSKDRGTVIEDVTAIANAWSEENGVKLYLRSSIYQSSND